MKKRVACAAALFVIWGWGWISPPQAWAQLSSLVVTMTSPTSGSTVSGTITVRASVTIIGALTVEGVQFQLDGANLGAEDTTAPYSVPWDTTATSNGSHSLRAVARDAFGIRYTSNTVTVTVSNAPPPDTTPPTVSITSPANGEPVSGTRSVTATASDNVGVAGVQFFVDSSPLGAEDTTAPFSRPWDTTSASNASHTLTAVARDAAGNTTTSAPVTVTVSNAPPAPTITSFTPTSGPVGTNVTISGTNFTGTSSVTFNGTSASFSVSSATSISATVPSGATSGPISVTTDGGTATSSNSFTVTASTPAPTITSFTPTSGPVGTSVTINGTNFTGASSVTFNGTSATFSVSSATVIQATVPAGATSGPISVTTDGGTATSASPFTVGPPPTGGDVFVALDDNGPGGLKNGVVQWRNPDGSLRRELRGNTGGQASSVAFDAAGNLYVPHWCQKNADGSGDCSFPHNTVERWDANGNLLGTFGRDANGNNPYFCNPSSIAFDAAGNMYVGQADCTGDILKFNAAGTLVDSFHVFTTNRGTDHIALASDGCTMFYTSRDRNIYRYNVCTRTQLSPFNILLLPGSTAYHLAILPDGGVLVADSEMIVRLDSAGNQIKTYTAPGETNIWGGVDFVGDGTFWATNAATDNVYRFDLQSGTVLASFNATPETPGVGGDAAGVGVRR